MLWKSWVVESWGVRSCKRLVCAAYALAWRVGMLVSRMRAVTSRAVSAGAAALRLSQHTVSSWV
jgi:hypothetical protein